MSLAPKLFRAAATGCRFELPKPPRRAISSANIVLSTSPRLSRPIHSGTAHPRSKSDNPDVSERVKIEHAGTAPVGTRTDAGRKQFADFDLAGKVFLVTGGAQGLGLALCEALVEAGGKGRLLPVVVSKTDRGC